MLLPGAGDQELMGLWVAIKTDQRVFFHQPVQSSRKLVFVGAGARFDGKGNCRFGQHRGLKEDLMGLVAQRVSGECVLELVNRTDVPGMQLRDRHRHLAFHHCQMAESLHRVAVIVLYRRVVAHYTGENLEERYMPRKRVGDRFKNIQRKRLVIGHWTSDHFCPFAVPRCRLMTIAARNRANNGMDRRGSRGYRSALNRGRRKHPQEFQQLIGCDIGQSRSEQHRKDPVLPYRLVQGGNQMFFRNGALGEILLHQLIFAFRDQFHQRLMCRFRRLQQLRRNLASLPFAI